MLSGSFFLFHIYLCLENVFRKRNIKVQVSKKIEKMDNSAVKLTITVPSKEGDKAYNDLLNKYSKEVQIKGFRKGKVPRSVLEKKFGEGLVQETAGNLLDEAFKAALADLKKEEQPLGYEYPEVQGSPDLELGKDFSFDIVYDVYPQFELADYKGIEIEEPQVKILKKDEEAELNDIQEKNAMVIDKKNKTIAGKNVVTIDYCEVDDEDNEIESTKRADFVFTVGTEENYYKFDKEIRGMKVDQEKIIEKEYADDFEVEELAGSKKRIKVLVKAVKEKQLPELDDELAQDVSEKFETLDDLKANIKEQLQEKLDNKLRAKMTEELTTKLAEANEINVPSSMLKAELENSWRSFIQRFGMPEEQLMPLLEAQGKTKEDMMKDWEEDALKSLKTQLVLSKIQEQEKIEVSDEDLEEEMKKQAEAYNMSLEDLKKTFGENGLVEYLKNDISQKKLIDFLLDNAKKSKGEKLSYEEFIKA